MTSSSPSPTPYWDTFQAVADQLIAGRTDDETLRSTLSPLAGAIRSRSEKIPDAPERYADHAVVLNLLIEHKLIAPQQAGTRRVTTEAESLPDGYEWEDELTDILGWPEGDDRWNTFTRQANGLRPTFEVDLATGKTELVAINGREIAPPQTAS